MAPRSARALALAALSEWRRGRRFADAILHEVLSVSALAPNDRGFANELFYGVLRNLTLLDFWIAQLRSGAVDNDSRDLLRLGLYQLFVLRTPGHAAVFETVELSGRRNRSLINAVLRAALRRAAALEAAARTQSLATRFSHPTFWVQRWSDTFGSEAATRLCEWNNEPAPLYARINQLRTTIDKFLTESPSTRQLSERPNFVRLNSIPADALARGDCYIQDLSTGLACELLDPQPGETVLDACAAPGGKSGFIAELMENRGRLIACDHDRSRLETLQQNLAGLGATSAQTILQDWTADELSPQLQLGSFDRVLVDAPCTNTGVMRRRIDVRWRLSPTDFKRMQTEQLAILRHVVPLLKPGGSLVYSTCSIEKEENEDVVERAKTEMPSLRFKEQKAVLPFRDQFDGAFVAKFTIAS